MCYVRAIQTMNLIRFDTEYREMPQDFDVFVVLSCKRENILYDKIRMQSNHNHDIINVQFSEFGSTRYNLNCRNRI